MKNLRLKFERFCARNSDKGISNLMLYIVIGNLIVFLIGITGITDRLFSYLIFDPYFIMKGQVWRLFTYVFTYLNEFSPLGLLLSGISLYCYYLIGKHLEAKWGVFRFNLFYFSGMVIMAATGLIFHLTGARILYLGSMDPSYYLHLSLILAFATVYPEVRFYLFMTIPIRARWLALLDLGLTLWAILQSHAAFPYNLFPLFALLNYFLFMGSSVLNLIPLSWQLKLRRKPKKKTQAKTIPFSRAKSDQPYRPREAAYTHKCTVCGRTDVSHPDLEFRYCSLCNGYYCYCIDHINDHTHIQ